MRSPLGKMFGVDTIEIATVIRAENAPLLRCICELFLVGPALRASFHRSEYVDATCAQGSDESVTRRVFVDVKTNDHARLETC
jgi:hypothetical protein